MTDRKKGKVYLVGSGPGDPELITIKGKRLLDESDVVVYDNLVPAEHIISLSENKEKYYVGKKAKDHALSQDKINELLVKLASEGKNVTRLKGSDPLIFGRGGEEAKYLRKHNIDFEIVPGIPAVIGAAAYSGIPCTDRDSASFTIFVTGHKALEKSESSVPWPWIAQAQNGSVIIYMGVGEIENISRQLIESGMAPDKPAAVIERGTIPTQRVFVSTLENIPDTVTKENVKQPALFVLGEVVKLREYLKWFEQGPLFGRRIMVLRPADQAQDMYESLRHLGAELLPYPTIATREENDSEGWANFTNINKSDRWLFFTSENGVRYFFNQLAKYVGDIRALGNFKIAAVGYGTARALKERNLKADFVPTKATVVSMANEMCDQIDLKEAAVVRVRGNLAEPTAEETLSKAGADIIPLTVYQTYFPDWPAGLKVKLFDFPPDVIIFSSGSTATGLCEMLSDDERHTLLDGKITVSIGPSTTKIIKSYGIDVTLEAREHNVDGLIKEVLQYYANKKRG